MSSSRSVGGNLQSSFLDDLLDILHEKEGSGMHVSISCRLLASLCKYLQGLHLKLPPFTIIVSSASRLRSLLHAQGGPLILAISTSHHSFPFPHSPWFCGTSILYYFVLQGSCCKSVKGQRWTHTSPMPGLISLDPAPGTLHVRDAWWMVSSKCCDSLQRKPPFCLFYATFNGRQTLFHQNILAKVRGTFSPLPWAPIDTLLLLPLLTFTTTIWYS